MRAKSRITWVAWVAGLFAVGGVNGAAGQVTISGAEVANVTPSAFSICWRVDDATVPGLDVFSDAAGTVPVVGQLGLEFYPLEQDDTPIGNTAAQRAARRGLVALMKAEQLVLCDVTGATPGVTYYVRPRSYDGGGADNAAAPAALVAVTTPGETGFVWESRQLVVNFATAGIDANGMVARLSKADAAYPLVSVVGDHGLGNKAYFDLSDLLASGGSTNLELSGAPEFSVALKGLTSPGDANTRQITLQNDFVVAGATEVPFSISADPNLVDTDGDLIPDVYEDEVGSDRDDPSDATSDGDGDNIPLVVEWALRLNPNAFDVDPLSIDLVTGGDGKLYPCIEYYRSSTAALGLTLTIKDSATLAAGGWGDLTGASQALDPNGDDDGNPYRVAVEVTPDQAISDPGAPDRQFYQLCVEGVVAGEPVSWRSKPVGFISTTQLAGGDRFTSIPFHRQPAFNGLVDSVSGADVTVQGSPDWATSPKQFVFAAGVQEERYFACIVSGNKAGYLFKVVDNGSATVTLDLNGNTLDGVVPGDQIVVVPYWTLDTVFPNGRGITASVTPSDLRTVVYKPDFDATGTNQSADEAFFYIGAPLNRWLAPGRGGTDMGTTPLDPGRFFIVRQGRAQEQESFLFGCVPTHPIVIPLYTHPTEEQDNYVALDRPAGKAPTAATNTGVSLADSGLISSGAFQPSASPADLRDILYVYENGNAEINKAAVGAYAFIDPDGPGGVDGFWVELDSGSTNQANAVVFKPGVGVVIRKAPVPGGVTSFWLNLADY